jgi:ComF family protein
VAALGRALLSFVYPPHCILCDKLIGSWAQAEAGICPACVTAIREQPRERCLRCSSPLGTKSTVPSGCPTCASWPVDCGYERAISLGSFDGPLRDAVHALKFKGNRKIGRVLGQWLGASESEFEELDALIPVPLHPSRQRDRGYNQAELIGRGFQQAKETSLISGALVRARATAQQAQTASAEERAHNLAGAFVARGRELEAIRSGGIAGVVDDVLTTGATVDACGRAILEVRPDLRVIAIVAAITP